MSTGMLQVLLFVCLFVLCVASYVCIFMGECVYVCVLMCVRATCNHLSDSDSIYIGIKHILTQTRTMNKK